MQGMEQNKLQAEKAELEANIAEYNRLLSARENIVEQLSLSEGGTGAPLTIERRSK